MNNEMQTGRKAFSTNGLCGNCREPSIPFGMARCWPFFSFRLPLSSWCTPREPEVFTGYDRDFVSDHACVLVF